MNEPRYGEIGDQVGDLGGRLRAVLAIPVRGPVQRAEERAGGDGRVRGPEHGVANPGGDERANAAFVAIALGDDPRAKARRQGVHFEVGRRALDVVEENADVRAGDAAQPRREGAGVAPGGRERVQKPIERAILTEEQEFVLAAEVMIEIARRQVGRDGDVAHAGCGEATGAEHASRGADDRDAPGVRAFRTAVRKMNHRSILQEFVTIA